MTQPCANINFLRCYLNLKSACIQVYVYIICRSRRPRLELNPPTQTFAFYAKAISCARWCGIQLAVSIVRNGTDRRRSKLFENLAFSRKKNTSARIEYDEVRSSFVFLSVNCGARNPSWLPQRWKKKEEKLGNETKKKKENDLKQTIPDQSIGRTKQDASNK